MRGDFCLTRILRRSITEWLSYISVPVRSSGLVRVFFESVFKIFFIAYLGFLYVS